MSILSNVNIDEKLKEEIRNMNFHCNMVRGSCFSITSSNENFGVFLYVDDFGENELCFPMRYDEFKWDGGWIYFNCDELIKKYGKKIDF